MLHVAAYISYISEHLGYFCTPPNAQLCPGGIDTSGVFFTGLRQVGDSQLLHNGKFTDPKSMETMGRGWNFYLHENHESQQKVHSGKLT